MFIFDKIETPSLVFKCMARVFYTSYNKCVDGDLETKRPRE